MFVRTGRGGAARALVKDAPEPGATATTLPDPTPRATDVLLRVEAASVWLITHRPALEQLDEAMALLAGEASTVLLVP